MASYGQLRLQRIAGSATFNATAAAPDKQVRRLRAMPGCGGRGLIRFSPSRPAGKRAGTGAEVFSAISLFRELKTDINLNDADLPITMKW